MVSQAGFESAIDYATLFAGRAKALQGRHAEAEIDMRRALLSRLKSVGKYHADTANMLNFFSELLFEQSRMKESEALARASIEILRHHRLWPRYEQLRFRAQQACVSCLSAAAL